MAKKAKPTPQENPNGNPNEESIQGYFRRVFQENPKLLKSRSNAELLRRWLVDHPEQTEVSQRVKSGLSNLKSVLRSNRRKKTAEREASGNLSALRTAPPKSKLESLEEQIDECLTYARTLDPEGLEIVILHLRKARNAVVWMLGQ